MLTPRDQLLDSHEEFRKLALAKVQEKAAEDHVKFGSTKGQQ